MNPKKENDAGKLYKLGKIISEPHKLCKVGLPIAKLGPS